MAQKNITVFGGSGFLGGHIVRELARAGATIRVACRDREAALPLKTLGFPGQVVPIQADIMHEESVRRAVEGADAVVNLVGILYERGKRSFHALHVQGAERVARAAKAAGAEQLVHVSALAVERAQHSAYARTKREGEKAVLTAFPRATIMRPGVVFGPEDNFFNQFAQMACLSPFLPLIGGGKTRFQPVYAGDVAKAVVAVLERPEAAGRTYELGGPAIYTFRQILEYILKETGRCAALLPMPFFLAGLEAMFLQLLPVPPLTPDQVRLLKVDNVVAEGALTLKDLGITPTAVEAIVPAYLQRFKKK